MKIYKYFANIRARVTGIESFSAHADQASILKWLGGFTTKPMVFITHGEDDSRAILATKIGQQLKSKTYQPKLQEIISL